MPKGWAGTRRVKPRGARRLPPRSDAPASRPTFLMRLQRADRSSLLVTTALASTLLIGTLLAPTPSVAQTTTCSGGPAPGPTPILEIAATSIICVNGDDRVSNGDSPDAIALETNGDDHFINLDNSGDLTATDDGIDAVTDGRRQLHHDRK